MFQIKSTSYWYCFFLFFFCFCGVHSLAQFKNPPTSNGDTCFLINEQSQYLESNCLFEENTVFVEDTCYSILQNSVTSLSSNTSANVHFKRKGTIELLPGSVLLLWHRQRLTISAQGSLIVHPGASILLASANAELLIEGTVRLLPGASFSPTGNGTVRFAQNPNSPLAPPSFWDVDSSNSVVFSGSQGNLKVVLVLDATFPSQLGSLSFDRVLVELFPNVLLQSDALAFSVFQSSFVAGIPGQKYRGVRATFSQHFFDGGHFSEGSKALSLLPNSSNASLVLENMTFLACDTGLSTINSDVYLEACSFSYCQLGWYGLGLLSASQINNSDFFQNSNGASCFSATHTHLQVYESAFYNNLVSGLLLNNGMNHISCSNFSFNGSGLAVSNQAKLDLVGFGGNLFRANSTALLVADISELNMRQGGNSFTQNGAAISGSFSENTSQTSLDVFQNEFQGSLSLFRVSQGVLQNFPVINYSPFFQVSPPCARQISGGVALPKANFLSIQENIETLDVSSEVLIYPQPATHYATVEVPRHLKVLDVTCISSTGVKWPISFEKINLNHY